MKIKRPPILCGTFAIIPLTQGKHAVIDIEDLPLVEGWNWHTFVGASCIWYARTNQQAGRPQLRMHRVIMRPPAGMEVDHINHDGLNNRRRNLRICTRMQNARNGRTVPGHASQYRGVCSRYGKWYVTVRHATKRMHVGYFTDEIEAAKAYDKAAAAAHGEFATLNFPTTADSVIPSPRTNLTDNPGTPVGGTTIRAGLNVQAECGG